MILNGLAYGLYASSSIFRLLRALQFMMYHGVFHDCSFLVPIL
jgi:hypothetical protein